MGSIDSSVFVQSPRGGDIAEMEDQIIFETKMPSWNEIKRENGVKFEWNDITLKWDESRTTVKIAPNPFGQGSLRLSYYCLDLPLASKHQRLKLSCASVFVSFVCESERERERGTCTVQYAVVLSREKNNTPWHPCTT